MLLTGHEVKAKSLYRPLNFHFISYVYSQSASGVLSFSIAGKSVFHTWKNNFPEEEKQLSTYGKQRLPIREVCALPYPRLSVA